MHVGCELIVGLPVHNLVQHSLPCQVNVIHACMFPYLVARADDPEYLVRWVEGINEEWFY